MTQLNQLSSAAPVLALTAGDPAGVGPEIIAGAWSEFFPESPERAAKPQAVVPLPASRPIAFGDPNVLRRAVKIRKVDADVVPIASISDAANDYFAKFGPQTIPCFPCCDESVQNVKLGEISAEAGDAAFKTLDRAIDFALSNDPTEKVDGIVTAPLHKEALNLAGHKFPGHTEILAARCGVSNFGMALYLGPCPAIASPTGLGVVHVTLHTSMRKAVDAVTFDGVREKIGLIRRFMRTIIGREPKIGVCALNCHSGDGGLFGDEEIEIIGPAVEAARRDGADVRGPQPSDTLFLDAKNGLFDGIVAAYHDQGHIAVKALDMFRAVNVALGLPIIRTSVAHGTAFNIAGRGIAKTESLIEAVRVAAVFAAKRETP